MKQEVVEWNKVQAGTGRFRIEQKGAGWNRRMEDGTGSCRLEQEGAGWNRKM